MEFLKIEVDHLDYWGSMPTREFLDLKTFIDFEDFYFSERSHHQKFIRGVHFKAEDGAIEDSLREIFLLSFSVDEVDITKMITQNHFLVVWLVT